ncbi:MAG: GMC family oxidoreductase N-terminal domain-containing protein, partial [Deltaproteobacteria bacterium]
IPLPGGRGVGGSTLVNSGICFRAPDSVRRRWASFGLDWATPGGELDGIYDEIEGLLSVTKTDPSQAKGNNLIFKKGVDKLGLPGDFISRNAPGCVGCGVCQLGCPIGGKASTDLTLIPDAIDHGAEVFTGSHVERVLLDHGRCVGVEGTVLADDDRPVGRFRVRAGKTVIAGSAIGTPLLLWRSGTGNRSGQVGKNLHVHPGTGTIAFFDEEIRLWDGVTQGYYVDLADEQIVIETFSATPETYYTLARKAVGADLRKMNRMASCGAMIADRSSGTVRPSPDGRSEINYSLGEEDRVRLIRSLRFINTVYAAAGAVELQPGVAGQPTVRTLDEALAQLHPDVAVHDMNVYASHPQGTCRMGVDPDESVVRPDGRTHDVDALYVADGSLFPEALGVNPQITIMSLAVWVGRRIAQAG